MGNQGAAEHQALCNELNEKTKAAESASKHAHSDTQKLLAVIEMVNAAGNAFKADAASAASAQTAAKAAEVNLQRQVQRAQEVAQELQRAAVSYAAERESFEQQGITFKEAMDQAEAAISQARISADLVQKAASEAADASLQRQAQQVLEVSQGLQQAAAGYVAESKSFEQQRISVRKQQMKLLQHRLKLAIVSAWCRRQPQKLTLFSRSL